MELTEKIVSLTKRRGFIFPGSELYGGLGSFYDYGHYGILLKQNIKNAWWYSNVLSRDDVLGLDSTLVLHPDVWKASGHLSSFTDPLVECKNCHHRFRADHLKVKDKCPDCQGELTKERQFNLMFKTYLGPVEDSSSIAYLRPETAQGIFINFNNYVKTYNKKIPFGIAQIGKAFRNEITPGNFIFRMREFEQMEIEFFVNPDEDEKWYKYWLDKRLNWYIDLGIKKEKLRIRHHEKSELSHYSKATADIEYQFPWGWGELEGVANRSDYDLKAHWKFSGKDLTFFDERVNKNYVPFVIEPSAGADRSVMAFLLDSYSEDSKRVVMKFHPKIAPVKVAVFPLVSNKKEIVDYARNVFEQVRTNLSCVFDDRGNIGKRYYSQDEIGTPWCVTIDYDTLKNNTITVRNRDTTLQERINVAKLKDYINLNLNS